MAAANHGFNVPMSEIVDWQRTKMQQLIALSLRDFLKLSTARLASYADPVTRRNAKDAAWIDAHSTVYPTQITKDWIAGLNRTSLANLAYLALYAPTFAARKGEAKRLQEIKALWKETNG